MGCGGLFQVRLQVAKVEDDVCSDELIERGVGSLTLFLTSGISERSLHPRNRQRGEVSGD